MRQVALAAPHRLALAAGEAAVRAGGNALDAALAAAVTLTVVYPHQCSLGGDMIALVRGPAGEVSAIISVGAAADAVDVEAIRSTGAGMPRQGPLTVTVPGVVAGWVAVAHMGAELPLSAALAAGAELADGGVEMAAGLADATRDRITAVRADPGLRALLLGPDREPLPRLSQPKLAGTLRTLAADPDSLYRGALAASFTAGLQRLGSPLSADDLHAHRVELTGALTLSDGGDTWWAAPPPSQGAIALALLDRQIPGDLLTRARAAHRARTRLLGDPAGGAIDLAGLLAPAPLSESTGPTGPTGSTGSTGSTGRAEPAEPAPARASGDTVAITAVDSDGTCVSVIQSLFQSFGAGLLEPDTGIVLQNRGSAFVVLDDRAAHARHPAALEPGRRPPHTLCPLIGDRGHGRVRVALGCQGGRAQPLILAQVAAATLDPERELAPILATPRWVVGDRDLDFASETVLTEAGAVLESDHGLGRVTVPVGEDRCGHVQVARLTGSGLSAAGDPRADGGGLVISAHDDGAASP